MIEGSPGEILFWRPFRTVENEGKKIRGESPLPFPDRDKSPEIPGQQPGVRVGFPEIRQHGVHTGKRFLRSCGRKPQISQIQKRFTGFGAEDPVMIRLFAAPVSPVFSGQGQANRHIGRMLREIMSGVMRLTAVSADGQSARFPYSRVISMRYKNAIRPNRANLFKNSYRFRGRRAD